MTKDNVSWKTSRIYFSKEPIVKTGDDDIFYWGHAEFKNDDLGLELQIKTTDKEGALFSEVIESQIADEINDFEGIGYTISIHEKIFKTTHHGTLDIKTISQTFENPLKDELSDFLVESLTNIMGKKITACQEALTKALNNNQGEVNA